MSAPEDRARDIRRAVAQMAASRWAATVASLAALMALSRLLPPDAFGLYAGLLAICLLADVIADFGVSARLVQRAEPSADERAAGEGLALALGLACGAALAVGAALAPASVLTEEGQRTLWLLAACVPVLSVGGPLEATLSRDLDFRVVSMLGVGRAVAEAGVAIGLAVMGAGAPALAGGLLAGRAAQAGVLLVIRARGGGYRPRLRGAGAFARFGRPYVLMEATPRVGDAATLQVIGGALGLGALGVFDRAKRVTGLLDQTLLAGVMPVVLPALSRSLDAGHAPGTVYLRKVSVLAALLWPAFALIALMAEPIIAVLLGAQWADAVWPVRILCLAGLALPVGKMSMKMFVAMDDVPAYARIQMIHQALRVAMVGLGALHSLEAACLGGAASSFVKAALIERRLSGVIGVDVRDLARTAGPAAWLAAGALAGPAVLLALWGGAPPLALCSVAALLAGAGWLGAAALTRHPLFADLLAAWGDARTTLLRRPARP